jgi:hypothetical protein
MSRDKPDRHQRLAEALRANLRRRKGQAREWAEEDGPRDQAPPAEPQTD